MLEYARKILITRFTFIFARIFSNMSFSPWPRTFSESWPWPWPRTVDGCVLDFTSVYDYGKP